MTAGLGSGLLEGIGRAARAQDAAEAFGVCADLLREAAQASHCLIFWLDDERRFLRRAGAPASEKPVDMAWRGFAGAMGLLQHAIVGGRPVLIRAAGTAEGLDALERFWAPGRRPDLLAFPLGHAGRGTLGAALLLEPDKAEAFLEGDEGAALRETLAALIDARVRADQSQAATARLSSARDSAESERRDLRRRRMLEGAGLLWGSSAPLRAAREQIQRAALVGAPVLILGETGSGKELAAREIHALSERSSKPFVALNCAALPASLLESELFGHAKGAFTGAGEARKGLLRDADGGILFLDEIGELPLSLQGALLRALQEGAVRPLGEAREIKTDFRLVCATHRDLEAMAQAGSFRSDLLFRIRRLIIRMPPLREMAEDLPLLAGRFVEDFNRREKTAVQLAPEAWRALEGYAFPGNVRELQGAIERACLNRMPDGRVEAEDLRPAAKAERAPTDDLDQADDLRAALESFEKALIARRLRQHQGDRARAAESLNIPKRTLADRCKRYDL